MFGKLNHLAITSDHYTLLGMFYRAIFGLQASGDTAREIGAISVGDGYVGMTHIPRRDGRTRNRLSYYRLRRMAVLLAREGRQISATGRWRESSHVSRVRGLPLG